MSYTVNVTVNLPDNIEVDLTPVKTNDPPDWLEIVDEWLDYSIPDVWSSLVITVVNSDPPQATKTFVEPL
jgi:hypothetical protein